MGWSFGPRLANHPQGCRKLLSGSTWPPQAKDLFKWFFGFPDTSCRGMFSTPYWPFWFGNSWWQWPKSLVSHARRLFQDDYINDLR